MNILQIKIGNYYESDYSDFLFHTNRPVRDFYDENFNLTEWFVSWLANNKPAILEAIKNDRLDEINFYHDDSIEII